MNMAKMKHEKSMYVQLLQQRHTYLEAQKAMARREKLCAQTSTWIDHLKTQQMHLHEAQNNTKILSRQKLTTLDVSSHLLTQSSPTVLETVSRAFPTTTCVRIQDQRAALTTHLPDMFFIGFTALVEIHVQHLGLTHVPEAWGALATLRKLFASK
jgi:hypothetical protein